MIAHILDRLAAKPLDLLVVGGGIVGSGVARDAALRGLHTGLVEQYDFAFGTSSRSSRMLHGGLRYLAQGRVGLVREASREKHVLRRIAPHLAEPLAFVFPTYRNTIWPLWQLRLGVKIYDWLCGEGNLGTSGSFTPAQACERLPGLRAEMLTGAVRYFDGLTNDARLVLDTLRSAANAGALVANYTRLQNATFANGLWRCLLRETEAPYREATVQARVVVSATGPWAGGQPLNALRLRLTKGVHLVLDHHRLPVPDAVVLTEGSRILFVLPWGERVIIGTTDTDFTPDSTHVDPLAHVRTSRDDVDYILKVANAHFPEAHLTPADVHSSWAGLRPLIADPRGGPSDISRTHQLRLSPHGWLEVAGGKLTTYRVMAEQAVTLAARHLGRELPPTPTAQQPLLPIRETAYSSILPPPVTPEAVTQFCTREWARHLDDVLVRRSSWHYYLKPDEATTVIENVSRCMAEHLGWDAARQEDEIRRYRDLTVESWRCS